MTLEAKLCEALGCAPQDVVSTVETLIERSNRRGAVAGDTLVSIGLLHANARNLARFVLSGDHERARELALHLHGQAGEAAKRVEAHSDTLGLRGWWTSAIAEAMLDSLRAYDHEAGFQVAIGVNTSEGPLTLTIRRGTHADHASATEQRNTELVTRSRAMAELLDTLCGLLVVSNEGGTDVDVDEIDRRLLLACDQWTATRAEMVRARVER